MIMTNSRQDFQGGFCSPVFSDLISTPRRNISRKREIKVCVSQAGLLFNTVFYYVMDSPSASAKGKVLQETWR